ncbi:hypothetical protein GCM10009720_18490 [Yaniella flava]|uniref:Uncharacterized protein n=1 Tax=Yaniella flava TaxID=287930 RepID=A0ABN2UKT8_9MICC
MIDAPGASRNDPHDYLFSLIDAGINNKLYGVLTIMRYLLCSIAPERTDVIDIADFIEQQATITQFDMQQLGFPNDWRSKSIWARDFSLDDASMVTASLLDRTDSLTAVDTRAVLTAATVTEPEKRSVSNQMRRVMRFLVG